MDMLIEAYRDNIILDFFQKIYSEFDFFGHPNSICDTFKWFSNIDEIHRNRILSQ